MFRENHVKANLRAGRKSFGLWLQSANAIFSEISGMVGYDFVIIDQEHGPGSIQSAIDMMRTLSGTPTTGIIRIPSADPIYCKRIMDAGAEGLLVPWIETAEQIKAVVDACRYPPIGKRGNAYGIARAANYGLVDDYLVRAQDNLLIIPQIESVEGVRNARAIAEVDGVDMVFIGPTDLSGSVGLPGQTGAPEVEKLIAEAIAGIRAAGKPVSTVPRDGKTWQDLFNEGIEVVPTGSDVYFFRVAAAAQFAEWKAFSGDKADTAGGPRYA